MASKFSKTISALWPFALLAVFLIAILRFSNLDLYLAAQVFGLIVMLAAVFFWALTDYATTSDNRVQSKLKELESVLKPYEGMKLRDMPPEVQTAVREKLGWRNPPAAPVKAPDKPNP